MQENSTTEQITDPAPCTNCESQNEQTCGERTNEENANEVNSFGKFKNAESLLNGYKQLEKEFTKKCQALKELENQKEDNFVDKDKLFEINPDLLKILGEQNENLNDKNMVYLLAEKLVGKINEPCNIINNDDFLNNYVYNNEKIISKIVTDYLDSLSSMKIPSTISGGGNSYISPTYRPRNLDEAGKLAKKFIENRRL